MVSGTLFLPETPGENQLPAFSSVYMLPRLLRAWPWALSFTTWTLITTSPLSLRSPSFPSKNPGDDTGPRQMTRGHLPVSMTSFHICKVNFAMEGPLLTGSKD